MSVASLQGDVLNHRARGCCVTTVLDNAQNHAGAPAAAPAGTLPRIAVQCPLANGILAAFIAPRSIDKRIGAHQFFRRCILATPSQQQISNNSDRRHDKQRSIGGALSQQDSLIHHLKMMISSVAMLFRQEHLHQKSNSFCHRQGKQLWIGVASRRHLQMSDRLL